MNLKLIRKDHTNNSAIGDLQIDGEFFCYTLEDKDRQIQVDGSIIPWTSGLKVYGETAIPYGVYEVITNYSNRFQKVMPLLLDVPGFEGVRIHSGNTAANTEGCILVGEKSKIENFIGKSRETFNRLFPKLKAGLEAGKVFITISKGG